jgi:hypothetical protein
MTENVDAAFEIVRPNKHDIPLKLVNKKITDAKSKLTLRDLTHPWELCGNYKTTKPQCESGIPLLAICSALGKINATVLPQEAAEYMKYRENLQDVYVNHMRYRQP